MCSNPFSSGVLYCSSDTKAAHFKPTKASAACGLMTAKQTAGILNLFGWAKIFSFGWLQPYHPYGMIVPSKEKQLSTFRRKST